MAEPHSPPRTYGEVGFLGFHLGLVAACACFYVSCLFVGMMLEFADAPDGALPWIACIVGPIATALLCALLGRRLLHLPASRAYRAIAACSFGSLLMLPTTCALLPVFAPLRYELHGPDSPLGQHTHIAVHGDGVVFGTFFFADITVRDANGAVAAEWRDTTGQGPRGGAEALRDSMRWTATKQLAFTTLDGPAVLDLK